MPVWGVRLFAFKGVFMPDAFINRIATAVPPHDVHAGFLAFGQQMLAGDGRKAALFGRMAERCGISPRHSFLQAGAGDGASAADAAAAARDPAATSRRPADDAGPAGGGCLYGRPVPDGPLHRGPVRGA